MKSHVRTTPQFTEYTVKDETTTFGFCEFVDGDGKKDYHFIVNFSYTAEKCPENWILA